ncbi:group II intron maturase-specific domain-containing protein [Paenibacillus sp. FSL R7-0297]|uniref:group II intron maturase-specific domain-containing protein n=1 Tax=unclassified Paenibacillus TaxID=185978 RepID=UPI0022AF14A2|nr:group II intron maturase-specific domain-containing protein [Paenibacillus sp. FSL R5-0912]
MRGWIGYYYVADMKRILQSWSEWLRRRLRMYIWKLSFSQNDVLAGAGNSYL